MTVDDLINCGTENKPNQPELILPAHETAEHVMRFINANSAYSVTRMRGGRPRNKMIQWSSIVTEVSRQQQSSFRNRTEIFLLAAFALQLSLAYSVSFAQTEYGQYPAGAFGQMKVAVLPPVESTIVENGTLIYRANEFVEGNGNTIDFDTNVVANRTLILRTTGLELLGADYAYALAVPIGNFAAPRPLPGDETALGLGDVYLQPFTLGWHGLEWHTTAAYGLFAPTGRFTNGARDNTGRGFWSHLLTLGITYLEQDNQPWNFTLQGRYEIPTKIDGTDIVPGNAFIVEYSVGKSVSDTLDLGLVGYASRQTTDITGGDFQGDSTRYQYYGTGVELQYQAISKPTWSMLISFRTYIEYNVINAPRGNFSVISFAFAV